MWPLESLHPVPLRGLNPQERKIAARLISKAGPVNPPTHAFTCADVHTIKALVPPLHGLDQPLQTRSLNQICIGTEFASAAC